MKRVSLEGATLLGSGNERLCYLHPEDRTKVIKVPHNRRKESRHQNELEYKYMQYLKKESVDMAHLAECYGWIETDAGRGLLFENIGDAITLTKAITQGILTLEDAKKALEDLRSYLEKNSILFVDVGLDNILCQKQKDSTYKLIIIDGLGARRPGVKLWFSMHCKLYVKYKLKKQWQKLQNNFEKISD